MTADTEPRNNRVNGLGRGAGGAANGGDHVTMNGNGHSAAHELSSATDDAVELLQPHEHDSIGKDDEQFYTGMPRTDIVKKLKDIFGSNFSSGRLDEIESLSQLLYGFGTTPLQQEQLDLIQARKAWLASKVSLPRFYARLQLACRSCGQLGHTSDRCQQQQAASASEGGEDGSEAGSSAAAGGKGKSSKGKRSKKASREAEAEAKKLAGAEAAAKRQAAIDAGEIPPEEPAAENDAAQTQADGNGDGDGDAGAKARQKAGRSKAAPAPVQVEEVEEEDEDGGAEDEGDLLELAAIRAAAMAVKSGKAAAPAAAQPAPQRKAAEPARSGSAGASAADADKAATKSAPPEHPRQQEPQAEPPQQDEGKGRRSGSRKKRSGGGGGGGGDGGDERQAPIVQADGRTASLSRPGSSGGRQDSQPLRRERDGTLSQCYRCGEYGHFRPECRAEREVPRENWPKHPPKLPPQQQPSRQQQQEAPRQQQQQLQQQQQEPPRPRQQQQQLQPPRQQQSQQQQPPPQQAQPVSPSSQGSSQMQHIHSALGHKPAEPGSWAHRAAPRTSSANTASAVSPGGGYGGFTAPPPPDHFAAGGSLLPPPHQQPPPQHASMLPPEQAPEEDEDDGMSELLDHLGIASTPSAPPAAAWGGGTAAQSWNPPTGDMEPPTQPQLVSPPSTKNPAELERERQEQADIDRALEASMKEQRGFGGSAPQRAAPTSTVAGAAAGLANDTGEYNCFLNAIIQCVWRCRDFRESILNLDLSHLPPGEGNPSIVRELVQLFRAMHEEAEGLAARVPKNPARPVVSPNGLREALSHCHAFQLGEMNDASEVLSTIYDALIDQGFRELVTSCFGLEIDEFVECDRCLMKSHEHSYTQYFQQVPAAALREAGKSAPGSTLAQHLLQIDSQSQKSCDKDMGGCGRTFQVTHIVKGDAPKVFSIELAWQSNTEKNETIADTLKAVAPNINASQRYNKLTAKWQRLCAMVCYYGQHYMAFVLMRSPGGTGEGRWILHDDANAMEVGDWEAVLHKCCAGRIQPSVLLYEDL